MLLALLSVGAIIFSEKQSRKQSQTAQTITPKIATITQKKMISGNLYPIREIEVKSAIPGILETYYVQIGDKVKKGEQIAKIQILSEPSQIESAKKNLNMAQITFEKDQLNYKRDQKLFEKGVIALTEFEETTKTYFISKEQYEYAQNQIYLLEKGYIPSSNISNVVTATTDGTIIDLPVEIGMPVIERNNFRDGTTIALIAQLDSFLFKGRIIENDVLSLKKGMKLTVIPTSMNGFTTEAIVQKISPKGYMDQGTMKYNMEAVFTLPDSVRIYSGFNATAEFVMRKKEDVLTIPEACLIFQNDSTFVEMLKNGKFEKKLVETGISDGMNIEITKEIKENDKIKNNIK